MGAAFSFHGGLGGSKSLFIRALISGSYGGPLEVVGVGDSEDVERVRAGLDSLRGGAEIDCGDGGAVLRFLALRASRVPGKHALTGSERLFSRPLTELTEVLDRLGVSVEVSPRRLVVTSRGWRPLGAVVAVDCSRSSQFASGVLVNCWDLPEPISIEPLNMAVSAGYWDLTKDLVTRLGMSLDDSGEQVSVPPAQRVTAPRYEVEIDMGSAFAVAAMAAVSGEAGLSNFPESSLQPDARFPELLTKMGVPVVFEDGTLRVSQAPQLVGIDVDLGNSPDLFPVLSVLAGVATGESTLGGASHLHFKESDRIAKVSELLRGMGRGVDVGDDGIRISASHGGAVKPFAFDADQDHRMAMAAAVARQAGVPVDITGGESVAKSFGSFWTILGWRP